MRRVIQQLDAWCLVILMLNPRDLITLELKQVGYESGLQLIKGIMIHTKNKQILIVRGSKVWRLTKL